MSETSSSATACCADVISLTVGMMLCNDNDFDYKRACFDAYDRWIASGCASAQA